MAKNFQDSETCDTNKCEWKKKKNQNPQLYILQLSKHEQGQWCGSMFVKEYICSCGVNQRLTICFLFLWGWMAEDEVCLHPLLYHQGWRTKAAAPHCATSQPNTTASSREPHQTRLRNWEVPVAFAALALHLGGNACLYAHGCFGFFFFFVMSVYGCWGLYVGVHQHCIVLWIWLTVKRRSKRRGRRGLPESSRTAGSIPRSQLPWAGCSSQAGARLPRPSWSDSRQNRRREEKKSQK